MVPRSLLILARVWENFLLYSMESLSDRLVFSREFIISLRGSIEVLEGQPFVLIFRLIHISTGTSFI